MLSILLLLWPQSEAGSHFWLPLQFHYKIIFAVRTVSSNDNEAFTVTSKSITVSTDFYILHTTQTNEIFVALASTNLHKSYWCVKYKSFLGLVHLWSLTDIVIFKVGTLIYRLHRRLVVLFVTLLFARRGRSFLPASRTSIFSYTARADHIIAWSRHQRSMRNYSRTCDRYGILLYTSKYSCNIISTLKKSQYQITRFYV